jgi:hypothetical protein
MGNPIRLLAFHEGGVGARGEDQTLAIRAPGTAPVNVAVGEWKPPVAASCVQANVTPSHRDAGVGAGVLPYRRRGCIGCGTARLRPGLEAAAPLEIESSGEDEKEDWSKEELLESRA